MKFRENLGSQSLNMFSCTIINTAAREQHICLTCLSSEWWSYWFFVHANCSLSMTIGTVHLLLALHILLTWCPANLWPLTVIGDKVTIWQPDRIAFGVQRNCWSLFETSQIHPQINVIWLTVLQHTVGMRDRYLVAHWLYRFSVLPLETQMYR